MRGDGTLQSRVIGPPWSVRVIVESHNLGEILVPQVGWLVEPVSSHGKFSSDNFVLLVPNDDRRWGNSLSKQHSEVTIARW